MHEAMCRCDGMSALPPPTTRQRSATCRAEPAARISAQQCPRPDTGAPQPLAPPAGPKLSRWLLNVAGSAQTSRAAQPGPGAALVAGDGTAATATGACGRRNVPALQSCSMGPARPAGTSSRCRRQCSAWQKMTSKIKHETAQSSARAPGLRSHMKQHRCRELVPHTLRLKTLGHTDRHGRSTTKSTQLAMHAGEIHLGGTWIRGMGHSSSHQSWPGRVTSWRGTGTLPRTQVPW